MENKGKAIISFLILAQLFGVATYANPGETCEDPILISLGQAYWGSTDIAAGPGGVGNGNEEGLDVWHAFTPGLSGAYTVTLSSTSLAATFSILDACDGIDITCNNDLGDYSVQSQRTVFLETGKTYLIRVTDYAGVTGEYALFVMNPDGPVADGFETGGFSASPWQGQGTPWHITLDTYHTGSFSAQSGSVDDNEHATLTLTHMCKAGDIRFAVKVSSERDHDTLIFDIDGQEISTWSGEKDWAIVDYSVTAGPHVFTWSYEKDAEISAGKDTAWIDEISLPLPVHDGFETSDFSSFGWLHQDTPWQIASDSQTGNYCAQSGNITDDENSTLSLERHCARGIIQFATKVSSEAIYDKLVFRIDDQIIDSWHGLTDWKEVCYRVSTGWHTFSWSYEKNGSHLLHEDAAWIDDVVFTESKTSESQADMHFVGIPGNTFEMGDHFNVGWFDEGPVHPVTLDSYGISQHETTNAQYAEFLNEALADGRVKVVDGAVYAVGGNLLEPYFDTHGASEHSRIVYNQGQFTVLDLDGYSVADHPVVKVSWYGATAFCAFYGYRLPTEAEWECAAQGGHRNPYYMYPWGSNTIDETKANYDYQNPLRLTSMPYTAPVGNYGSQGGLYDMAGNVMEWCQDVYGSYPMSYPVSTSPVSNPMGPSTGDYRVWRGGSWFNGSQRCRISDRNRYRPFARTFYTGFRACVSVSAPD